MAHCYTPSVLRSGRLGVLVLVALLAMPAAAAGDPPADGLLTEAEGEVESVWAAMQRLSEDHLPRPGDTDRTLWHVARGELAWRTGSPLVATMHLLEAVRNQRFQQHEAFPAAQYFLAEALLELRMGGMARPILERALQTGLRSRHYKHMLARYLELAWDDHDPAMLDRLVQHYRSRRMGRPEYDEADWRVRYMLGRVYLHRGRPDVARALLEGIPETDARHVPARHLLGVAHVAADQWEAAAAAFEDAARHAERGARALLAKRLREAAHTEEGKPRRPRVMRAVRRPSQAQPVARHIEKVVPAGWDESSTPDEEESRLRAVAVQAALARARLAMEEEDYETAWRWYRRVPPGAPGFRAILDEAIWSLVHREEFRRAEQATDALISGAGDGLLSGRARLLKAHLVVESGDFERGDSLFAQAIAHCQAALPGLHAAGEGLSVAPDGTVSFDPRVAAWSEPEALGAATVTLQALNERVVEVVSVRATVAALSEVVEDPTRMPTVHKALARSGSLRQRVNGVRQTLLDLRRCTTGCPPDPPGSGGDVPGSRRFQARLETVQAWADSLERHLDVFDAAVLQQARRQAEDVHRVVREEQARLRGVEAEIADLHGRTLLAAGELAAGARARAADLTLRSELGFADVAYRSKERLSKRIDALYREHEARQLADIRRHAEAEQTGLHTGSEVAWPPGLGLGLRQAAPPPEPEDEEK